MRLPSATALPLDAAAPPRERLREAARELETQFAQMLIKTMRSASFGDPMLGNNTTYREMHDQQLAKELARGQGLGLAPMIVRQLERGQGLSGGSAATTGTTPRGLPLQPASLPMAMPLSSGATGAMAGASGLALAPSSSGVSMAAIAPWSTPAPLAPATGTNADAFDLDGDASAKLDCSSPEAFVRSIWPHAQRTAAELGVPARALVAQAALETGWGRKLVGGDGSHNLFGIKATGWNGAKVSSATHEYVGGVRQDQRDEFRAYDSIGDSFRDYARLMRKDRYAGARDCGEDTARFATALQRAGYATDPSYAAKITAIANGRTLQRALAGIGDAPVDIRGTAYAARSAATTPRG